MESQEEESITKQILSGFSCSVTKTTHWNQILSYVANLLRKNCIGIVVIWNLSWSFEQEFYYLNISFIALWHSYHQLW
jgi:hypothetical protein